MGGLLEHLVDLEGDGGRDLHPQPAGDRLTKVAAGVVEPDPHPLERRVLQAVHGEGGARVLQIAGNAHVRDGDEAGAADARILDLIARQDLAEHAPHLARHALHPLRHDPYPSQCVKSGPLSAPPPKSCSSCSSLATSA